MQLKVHHIPILTNLLTLATLAYVGIRPAAASAEPKVVVTDNDDFERRHMTQALSGYRDIIGYDKNSPNGYPQYSDTLKIRKGVPFVFIAYELWLPKMEAPEELDANPEFIFPNGSAGRDEEDPIDHKALTTDNTGKIGIYTARTDTVDMQGQSKKRLQFTPIMRYPVGDEIVEFVDTIEVWVIDNE